MLSFSILALAPSHRQCIQCQPSSTDDHKSFQRYIYMHIVVHMHGICVTEVVSSLQNLGKFGMYRNHSLNTAMDRSKV